MAFTIWYSTLDLAQWLANNTSLSSMNPSFIKLAESDAAHPNDFHRMPDHLKKILYLDSPDLIIEKDGDPMLALESSKEAGTGHNAFQRFARIAAAVENNVPAIYIYPEATFITRQNSQRWDRINPNIFKAMEQLMQIYNIPALLFYHPTHYQAYAPNPPPNPLQKGLINDPTYLSAPNSSDPQMVQLFNVVDSIVQGALQNTPPSPIIRQRAIVNTRQWMQNEYVTKQGPSRTWSPDTSTLVVPTQAVMTYLSAYTTPNYHFGQLLTSRPETLIYNLDAKFRGDPYPGALAALDYMRTRIGVTFEERDKNLALSWGKVNYNAIQQTISINSNRKSSVADFFNAVRSVRKTAMCLLDTTNISALMGNKIPRYYMQARYGCTFTKIKHIRIYAFFADVILFPDGALWREG